MKLENKVALVFGGSSGLGRASAEACAQDGAAVVVADVNGHGGAQVVEGIRANGGAAAFVHTDITDEAAVGARRASTVEQLGSLDILVTSAAPAPKPRTGTSRSTCTSRAPTTRASTPISADGGQGGG